MAAQGSSSRTRLLKALEEALRKVTAQSVLISDTVAARVGLNSTDLECLDLLSLSGLTTAGRLAEHIGLTTGAMTAVLDRLERAGFVRRRRDTEDRRRVLVEALPGSIARIAPLYGPLSAGMAKLSARYGDRELAVIADYMSRAFDIGAGYVSWLQAQPPARRRSAGRRPPRAGRSTGRARPANARARSLGTR